MLVTRFADAMLFITGCCRSPSLAAKREKCLCRCRQMMPRNVVEYQVPYCIGYFEATPIRIPAGVAVPDNLNHDPFCWLPSD